MTTVGQMGDILNDLEIKNPEVIYYGWQPLGASSMPPSSLKLDSKFGNTDQLRSLIEKIKADGGNFYLYIDPQAALRHEKGYSPRYHLAMSITNSNLIGYNRNKVNYYLNFNAINKRYSSLSDGVYSKLGLAWHWMASARCCTAILRVMMI